MNRTSHSELQISVLVIEDEALTRTLISKVISAADFKLVGTAQNAVEAMRLFRTFKPQVVVTDIDLGAGPTGLDIASAISKISPTTGIVFVSSIEDVRTIRPNLPAAPATSQYLNKADVSNVQILIEVIRNAFEAALTGPTTKSKDESWEMSKEPFTDLQMELMRLISSGMSNVAIAAARFTTVKSTENAISRLAKKLGIPTDDKSNQRVLIAKYFFKLSKVQHIND
jgi:DNA-binding NarL/FixJ family response regulator